MGYPDSEGPPPDVRLSRNYQRLVLASRVFVVSIAIDAVAFAVAGPVVAMPLSWSVALFGFFVVAWMVSLASGVMLPFALARLKDEYGVLAIDSAGRRALMVHVAHDVFVGVKAPDSRPAGPRDGAPDIGVGP
jgi:hypothetical protein